MRARLTFLVAVLIASVTPDLAATREGDSVPFQLRDSSDVVVPVTICGQGTFRFLLDTGSSRTAITERVADDLRLQRIGRTVVVTPAGARTRGLVHTEIALGGTRRTLTVMVLPADDVGRNIDGIVGVDLLSTRRFSIDYVRRRVFFDGVVKGEGAVTVALTSGVNGFAITLPARGGEQPLRFTPDSGTATVVLFAREGRDTLQITPLAPASLRSLGGVKVGRAVLLDELRIGRIIVRDQLAVLVRAAGANERLGDGLLPLHLFARVTFDAVAGALTIVPYQ